MLYLSAQILWMTKDNKFEACNPCKSCLRIPHNWWLDLSVISQKAKRGQSSTKFSVIEIFKWKITAQRCDGKEIHGNLTCLRHKLIPANSSLIMSCCVYNMIYIAWYSFMLKKTQAQRTLRYGSSSKHCQPLVIQFTPITKPLPQRR